MPRKSIRLFAAAWFVFAVSLFLPAADDMVGWRCAATCAAMITDLNEWAAVYYFVFTIPNLLMLLSPLIVYRLNQKSRTPVWLNAAVFLCALYVLSFGVFNWFSDGFQLKAGYYMWLASFWLLSVGFVLMRRGVQADNTPRVQGPEMTMA